MAPPDNLKGRNHPRATGTSTAPAESSPAQLDAAIVLSLAKLNGCAFNKMSGWFGHITRRYTCTSRTVLCGSTDCVLFLLWKGSGRMILSVRLAMIAISINHKTTL